jgi:hypothetical protein
MRLTLALALLLACPVSTADITIVDPPGLEKLACFSKGEPLPQVIFRRGIDGPGISDSSGGINCGVRGDN